MEEIDDQQENEYEKAGWIVFEDGAFISKNNWLVRQWTRIGLIIGLWIGMMALWHVTVLGLVVQSQNIILGSGLLTEGQEGSTYVTYLATFLFFAYFSFRVSKFTGKRLFEKYLNEFLIHFKEDWKK